MNQYQTDVLNAVVCDLKDKADRVLLQAQTLEAESKKLDHTDRENDRETAALLKALSSRILTDSYQLKRLVTANGSNHA